MAAGYPNKEVEIVVPWAAGGATDMVFRAISTVFPKHANGQPLIIKNIPGGGAVPGTMEFLKGRPDGYTLLGIATPIITKIHMSEVPFDTDSFAPVIMVVENPCIIMVPAIVPDLNEFVDDQGNPASSVTAAPAAGPLWLAFEPWSRVRHSLAAAVP